MANIHILAKVYTKITVCKKAKSGKMLQITEEGREVKGKREREKYIPN